MEFALVLDGKSDRRFACNVPLNFDQWRARSNLRADCIARQANYRLMQINAIGDRTASSSTA